MTFRRKLMFIALALMAVAVLLTSSFALSRPLNRALIADGWTQNEVGSVRVLGVQVTLSTVDP